jgi:peptide/nickel transport system ATP-binding protein/oligopeptide transport system ATP-binding protein
LAVRPKLLIADEPMSALDPSIRAQIINVLREVQHQFSLTYLVIAHDLDVIEHMSDTVGVMYLGRLVELGPAADVYARPRMPYTRALLSAGHRNRHTNQEPIVLVGDPPSPLSPPSGCPFRTRCWMARDACATAPPPLTEVSPGHRVACYFSEEL